jgi:hypothetical protein
VYYAFGLKIGKEEIKIWGDKNKLWKQKLPTIRKYYPNVRFIHLVRDGRDVACSFKELSSNNYDSVYAPKLPSNIKDIAERWKINVNSIDGFLQSIPANNKITVKYEELVLDAESILQKLCAYLNIEYSDQMLNYQGTNKTLTLEPEETIAWKEKLNSKLDPDNIGKYKKELSTEEIEEFTDIAGKELEYYNYLNN